MTHEKQKQVLDFWFGEDPINVLDNEDVWFMPTPEFDQSIATQFGDMVADASTGAFDDWAKTPRGALALIILLDQFPRNMFRDDARAYANDVHSRRIAEIAIDQGLDQKLSAVERVFLYLPLEHSEDLSAQQRCVELVERLVNEADVGEKSFITQALTYALSHRDIIQEFGRFPHRNEVIGRTSTAKEKAFLKTPNSSF